MKRSTSPTTRIVSTVPHAILAIVSALFSGFFFWRLGTTTVESLMYLGLAVGMESAKVYFLWEETERRG